MGNKPRGYPAREEDQAPRLKFKHVLRSIIGLTPKKRSPYRDPSQPGGLQMSYDLQTTGLAELPDSPPGPNYFATHGQNHMNMWASPPMITTGYHTMLPEMPHHSEIIIALMGVTGAGKSYFIREVTGNPEVKVSNGLYSCTNKVQSYSFEYAGARITLVDTPGFDDTERSDTEVLQEIADWTSATYRKSQLLSGIIYLHPITHTRMEGSAMRNLRMFQSLCGQEALKNVFLTTTQWSNVNTVEEKSREDNLRGEGLWGGLIGKGATLQRFNGTRESGLELIDKLMSNTRKPLDIQDQIVTQNMTLLETNAGRCINEELAAQEKKFKEKIEYLEKQLRETMNAVGDEVRALREEQAKAQNMLQKAVAGMELLASLHAAEVRNREAREWEEEVERCDRTVIAVATKDIAITAHISGARTSYTTRGRLILDINNHEEFHSDTIEVTINYQPSQPSGIRGHTKTLREVVNAVIGTTSYIALGGVCYRCKSSTPIRAGSQEFVIFSKD